MSDTIKISELIPDKHNANRGTKRGRELLKKSLSQYGAGRSILLDKNGRIIAGNKTAEVAGDIGIEDVQIVRTDGKRLVAVLREDLDLDSDAARMLAYADNRTGEISLDWDAEALLADIQAGLPLNELWDNSELDAVITGIAAGVTIPEPKEQKEPMLDSECFIEIYCSLDDLEQFRSTLHEWAKRPNVTVNIS